MESNPVVIVRRLESPVGKVFAAWSKPELLRRWFASPNSTVEVAEIDLRPGGGYRVSMRDAEDLYVVFGEYRRVEPPSLLEFTWKWEESSIEKGESLVTISIEPEGSGSLLTLTHSKLATPKSEEMHGKGWTAILGRLNEYLISPDPLA